MPRRDPLAAAAAALRAFALGYPDSAEEFPWGERVVKVKGKVFVFLSEHLGKLHVGLKLPVSGPAALEMPFAEPTGYGLGKHGWVTATFAAGDEVPVPMLREWIDESYRAVAPKTVLAKLEEREAGGAAEGPNPAARKRPRKRTGS